MFKSASRWLLVILLAIAIGAGSYYYLSKSARKSQITASVLLEQVKEVTKLISLEGQFSELFRFEESWGFAISPLQKSAIIRVQATAFVGHDLEGLTIDTDETQKIIRIGPLPKAEIISLEKELDYYDFKQGLFNTFTKTDMNLIQHKADQIIRQEIQASDLILRAEQQLYNHLSALAISFESLGWKLEIVKKVNETEPLEPNPASLTPN